LKQKLTNRSGVLEAHVDAAAAQIGPLVVDPIHHEVVPAVAIILAETDPAPQWRLEADQVVQLMAVVEQAALKIEQRPARQCCPTSANNHNKTDEFTSATYPMMLSGITLKIL
jgi:hypothetical protein